MNFYRSLKIWIRAFYAWGRLAEGGNNYQTPIRLTYYAPLIYSVITKTAGDGSQSHKSEKVEPMIKLLSVETIRMLVRISFCIFLWSFA